MSTWLNQIPYHYRIAALLLLAAAVAGLDYRRHGKVATKWREYSFLLFAGLVGAAFGMICDSITSRLSPDYFYYGKGLTAGPDFHKQVLELGAQAGFVAAFFAGACYLFANNPKVGLPQLGYLELMRNIWKPLCTAAGLALGLGIGARLLITPTYQTEWIQFMNPTAHAWF
jgi:hypothetical protein